MPDEDSWQSPDATDYLDTTPRAGFAWEFLRRNPRYREDYATMNRQIATGNESDGEAAVALAQRWGLNFSMRSHAAKRAGSGVLAGGRACDGRARNERSGPLSGCEQA